MQTFLLVIHVFVCLFLIFIVLVQGGKGAEMGAAFGGGSSQTLFGGRGASTFLGKLTTIVAVVFMLTSLMLAVMAGRGLDKGVDLSAPAGSENPLNADMPAGKILNQTGPGGGFAPPADAPAAVPKSPAKPAAPAEKPR